MMATASNQSITAMRTLTVLGSTGSIGTNTLDVIRHSRHLYQVYALAAGGNVETLAFQIQEFGDLPYGSTVAMVVMVITLAFIVLYLRALYRPGVR